MSVITPMTTLSPPPPPLAAVAPEAALPPPALSGFLQAAAHSAAAHRVTIIERFARCLSIAAPRVFSGWLGSGQGDLAGGLDSKVHAQSVHAGREIGIGDHVDHPAMLHHVMAVRHGLRELDALLDQQDR